MKGSAIFIERETKIYAKYELKLRYLSKKNFLLSLCPGGLGASLTHNVIILAFSQRYSETMDFVPLEQCFKRTFQKKNECFPKKSTFEPG